MTITVKDLLDFIDKNQVPDDAVIIVPRHLDAAGSYPTTVWCDADDLSTNWDLNFHPDIDNKFFIGDV